MVDMNRMRFHFKVVVIILIAVLFLITMTIYNKCDVTNHDNRDSFTNNVAGEDQGPGPPSQQHQLLQNSDLDVKYRDIDCLINDEYTISCRKDEEEDEVFVPFSFLVKYFELYGEIKDFDGEERLDWRHSYSKVYTPQGKYSPQGIFMSFEHYNVEVRDRVKCVSGVEGVPISTQWGPHGYYYPIQIAQYGLSHYSKYLVDGSHTSTVIEDASDGTTSLWNSLSNSARVANVYEPEFETKVIQFESSDSWHENGVSLSVTSSTELFLSLDLKFASNGSLTVIVQPKGKKPDTYYIHYVLSQSTIEMYDNNIIMGIGDRTRWSHITRDLSTDFQKGLALKHTKKTKPKLVLHKIIKIIFRGKGWVDNVTLSNNAHLAQFYYAANWLVLHQDDQGGWPIMVTRKLVSGMMELPPGWYSAMAQGQAMSLLVRAYVRTRNKKYLETALKATHLFSIPSGKGGVLAHFAEKYVWYEEYPTTPSSYVLNGFIYSLLGLYDLKTVAPSELAQEAERLYKEGLNSLRNMIPLFDTGSGTVYDLRHYSLGSAPNLARWDYHATHINQLLLLSTIEDDPFYHNTAKRWIGYMKGKRAAHN